MLSLKGVLYNESSSAITGATFPRFGAKISVCYGDEKPTLQGYYCSDYVILSSTNPGP